MGVDNASFIFHSVTTEVEMMLLRNKKSHKYTYYVVGECMEKRVFACEQCESNVALICEIANLICDDIWDVSRKVVIRVAFVQSASEFGFRTRRPI